MPRGRKKKQTKKQTQTDIEMQIHTMTDPCVLHHWPCLRVLSSMLAFSSSEKPRKLRTQSWNGGTLNSDRNSSSPACNDLDTWRWEKQVTMKTCHCFYNWFCVCVIITQRTVHVQGVTTVKYSFLKIYEIHFLVFFLIFEALSLDQGFFVYMHWGTFFTLG